MAGIPSSWTSDAVGRGRGICLIGNERGEWPWSYLLGIDVGSTNLKAVLFGTDGRMRRQARGPTECFHPDPAHPDWAVWQPEQIWARHRPVGPAEAVVQSTTPRDQGRGGDRHGHGRRADRQGRASWLYPFISWHCPRTAPQQPGGWSTSAPSGSSRIGGNQIWTFNTALRLRWMREHEPAILDRTHKWLLIEDFVNFMLCGERATDYSMASTTLLFDQRTRDWNGRTPAAFRHRPPPALRSAARRHASGRGAHRRRPRPPGSSRGHAGRPGRTRLLLRLPADRGLRAGRRARCARHVGDGGVRPATSRC